jgi:hypothetical protein
MPQASKYAEYAEIQKAEIDAEGIKIRRIRGNTEGRDRCRRDQKRRNRRSDIGPRSLIWLSGKSLFYFCVFWVFRRQPLLSDSDLQKAEIDAAVIRNEGIVAVTSDQGR